jgi:hypothetical protein
MTGHVHKVEIEEVPLQLPNLVPHPVSFHYTVLVFTKNEIAITIFFRAIMIFNNIL